jgi:hypothetical protein
MLTHPTVHSAPTCVSPFTEAPPAGTTIMAKSSTSTHSTDGGSQQTMMPFGFDMLTAMTQPPLSVMTDMNGKLFEGITAFAKEWGDFLNRRLGDAEGLCRVLSAGVSAVPGRGAALSRPSDRGEFATRGD